MPEKSALTVLSALLFIDRITPHRYVFDCPSEVLGLILDIN